MLNNKLTIILQVEGELRDNSPGVAMKVQSSAQPSFRPVPQRLEETLKQVQAGMVVLVIRLCV